MVLGNVHFRKRSLGRGHLWFYFLDSTKTKRLGGILGTLDAEAVS